MNKVLFDTLSKLGFVATEEELDMIEKACKPANAMIPIQEKHPPFGKVVMVIGENHVSLARLYEIITSENSVSFSFLESDSGSETLWHSVEYWMEIPTPKK